MKYSRINLEQTNYQILENWDFVLDSKMYPRLHEIYKKYCQYKKFDSVMPLFDSQFSNPLTDVIGYNYNSMLIAFSIIKKYDSHNVEAVQFAWDYTNPRLRLGIESLKNECALYKANGFKFLYLGQADEYKSQIDGYEILGTL